MRAVLDDGSPLPEGWGNRQAAGMAVYRGNYRSALVGALESTFERTARYVGEAAFKQVCAHHALSHPPTGWTIDEAGAGFDSTCAELFGNNPEVADLAWLEWSMLQLATAPDSESLDPESFSAATADFGDEDWMSLRLDFQPRAVARISATNLTGLWKALDEDAHGERPGPRLAEPRGWIVSREGERPTFEAVEPDSAQGFAAMQNGASYGEVIGMLAGEEPDAEAIQRAAMRGEWLREGLFIAIRA